MTREEAIKHLKDIRRDMWTEESEVDAINMAIKALEQPEQKTGRWVYWEESVAFALGTVEIPYCRCSECNVTQDIYQVATMKFCPNCGAKMEREQKHLGNKSDLVILDEVKYE